MSADAVIYSSGGATDRGLRRAANEDSFIAEAPVFLVADGMGGHEAGAEASSRAIDSFRALAGASDVAVEDVERAFAIAADAVAAIPAASAAAGTTLSGVIACTRAGTAYWLVLNIGDSRTYRLTDDGLEQISVDHSAVQSMIERGEVSREDAERHPRRNVVTRAVGAGSSGVPDYWLLPIGEADRIIVCSDGLTKEIPDVRIAEVLDAEPSAQAAATRLVHEALLKGGRDNVTVVVVQAQGVENFDDDPTTPTAVVVAQTRPRSGGGVEGDRVAHL